MYVLVGFALCIGCLELLLINRLNRLYAAGISLTGRTAIGRPFPDVKLLVDELRALHDPVRDLGCMGLLLISASCPICRALVEQMRTSPAHSPTARRRLGVVCIGSPGAYADTLATLHQSGVTPLLDPSNAVQRALQLTRTPNLVVLRGETVVNIMSPQTFGEVSHVLGV